MKITKLLAISIGLVASSTAYSQSDLVNFSGLGRVNVENDKITGEGVKNDTTSIKRATGGYTLFDLGINVSPNELVKASVILRARNTFGGFYGDGASLQIRQFRVEGLLGKIVKYQVGDIDLGLTPYTLHNFEEVYHDYESDLFKIRRDIVSYENFNFGNKWRLQGLDAKTTLKFAKIIDKLKLNAFGTRVKQGNFATNEPDRLLYGGRVHVIQSKYFEIAGNLTGLSDVAGTVRDSIFQYDNLVATTDLKGNYEIGKFEIKAFAELGSSNYSFKNIKKKKEFKYDDYFYDGGLGVLYKPNTFTIGLEGSYREVGALFSSPGAQTRRINDINQVELFKSYNNLSQIREATLFDRYTTEGLYNQSIRPVLGTFLPEYNNLTPYGAATPNRKGLTVKVNLKEKEKIVSADFATEMLTEVLGEGTKELRTFMGMRGGVLLNVNKLVKFKKSIVLSGGYRNEQTTRAGDAKVDLSSTIIDAGLTVEVLKGFDLIGGYKAISASGNEYTTTRNQDSGLSTGYLNRSINKNEGVVTGGFRYRFNNKTFFTVNYQKLAYRNEKIKGINYNIDQLFFNYTLVF
jgi:hypothetical protein